MLDQIIAQASIHRSAVDAFTRLEASRAKVQFGVSFLESILDDVKGGFLDDLTSQVEAEIAADYLGQAERPSR